MNIKNLIGNSAPITPANSVAKVDRQIKTDNTADRDANGQQFYQKEKKKEKMTKEQFDKAITMLKEKHFIKDMHWSVMPVNEGDIKYALVQDQAGNTIRKIIEYDLWEIFDEVAEETKGQLLKKTA
ncbi:hypothetical protein K2P97_04300 [bacterium]|nr:hypothetical protein [bacterium]